MPATPILQWAFESRSAPPSPTPASPCTDSKSDKRNKPVRLTPLLPRIIPTTAAETSRLRGLQKQLPAAPTLPPLVCRPATLVSAATTSLSPARLGPH